MTPRVARSGPCGVMASRLTPVGDPDLFPTPPWGARAGGELMRRIFPVARTLWECACGPGHAVHGLSDYFEVTASDAYVYGDHLIYDFYSADPAPVAADIVATNPPFGDLIGWIQRAYARSRLGCAMLMRLGVLAGQERHALLYGAAPLTHLAAFSERLPMHRGRWEADGSSATDYAWFFFSKARASRALRQGWVGLDIPPGTKDRLTRDSDAAFACGEGA